MSMTTLSLVSKTDHLRFLEAAIHEAMPGLRCLYWGEPGWEQAEVAVCWNPPHGALARMPRLRLVHSSGAGVDNILADRALPDVPLCRIVDDSVTEGMLEFVVWATLYFHRRFDLAVAQARQGHWFRPVQPRTARCGVGVLGMGQLGAQVARRLADMQFQVAGWSRTPKQVDKVQSFAGREALGGFLQRTQILVNLLPLTPDTEAILDRHHLAQLPQGAALVQCGRGQHLVVPDLVALLRSGHLRGAVLDVFDQEPLGPDDALWHEPGVLVTPHMAALAKPATIAQQIAENMRRLQAGEALRHQVDRVRGY